MPRKGLIGLMVLSWLVGAALPVAPAPGVTDDAVTLGSTLLLSGPHAWWGQGVRLGLRTAFEAANAAGGVHGRRLRVIFYDDQFHPPYARANVQRLLHQDGVFALVAVGGTATNEAIFEDVVREGVPNVGLISHAHRFVSPPTRTHFTLQPSYFQQAMGAVDYLVQRRGLTQGIAVLYENNAFGKEVLAAVQARLAQYGLELAAAAGFARGAFDVLAPVLALSQAGAQAVILATVARNLGRILIEARALRFSPLWVGLSNLARREVSELADANFDAELVVATPFMDPAAQTPGMVEFRRLLARFSPGHLPQEPELHGYATGRVVVAALQRAGRALTRPGFLAALETLTDFDAGTTPPLTFSPTRHYGSTAIRFIRPYLLRWQPVSGWQEVPEEVAPLPGRVALQRPARPQPAAVQVSLPELLRRPPDLRPVPPPPSGD
ncbi:MAG: lipoprotein [Candidatus Tectimicrobiota bacterium]|nr:MAG: lipoprotein [Candidatus Tectomicrobia bacterium]